MRDAVASSNRLGTYLRDRRTKLDPAAFGFPMARRRTPGLRREEVAQRANVSATWYTWLEQGRGGAPSAEVLDRIAGALLLTDAEREHLYLLGLGRPPEVRFRTDDRVSPRLQRVLDALTESPAIVRTITWNVVAWNRAAAAVLTDYATLPREERNILRLIFQRPDVRARQADWENVARFVVASFRADVARIGASREIDAFVDDLCGRSHEFAALWRDHDVRTHGEGTKHLRHGDVGEIAMEYSAFAVDGRPDLCMIVYNAASDEDARRIRILMDGSGSGPAGAR